MSSKWKQSSWVFLKLSLIFPSTLLLPFSLCCFNRWSHSYASYISNAYLRSALMKAACPDSMTENTATLLLLLLFFLLLPPLIIPSVHRPDNPSVLAAGLLPAQSHRRLAQVSLTSHTSRHCSPSNSDFHLPFLCPSWGQCTQKLKIPSIPFKNKGRYQMKSLHEQTPPERLRVTAGAPPSLCASEAFMHAKQNLVIQYTCENERTMWEWWYVWKRFVAARWIIWALQSNELSSVPAF